MKFGLYGLHKGESAEPAALASRARAAEDAGFESIWVGDHIALPPDAPDDAYDPRLEAIVTVAFLAAVTSRVRLGFGAIILPQRQPVLLAKQLTSVDVLSGGRVIAGFGVGYLEAELRALGASMADRGALTDEHLSVLQLLWDEPPPSFSGRFTSFDGVVQRPRPVQRPLPIVIGGESAAAHRRARAAGGWYGWERTPAQAEETIAALGGGLEISITPVDPGPVDAALVRAYEEAGVHRLILQPPDTTGAAMDELIAAQAASGSAT